MTQLNGNTSRRRMAVLGLMCLILPSCTGDPGAPTIWEYDRRHQQRMQEGRRSLAGEQAAGDMESRRERQLRAERGRVQAEIAELRRTLDRAATDAKSLGAEGRNLEDRARTLRDATDQLSSEVRSDGSEVEYLKARKASVAAEVARLNSDIESLLNIHRNR